MVGTAAVALALCVPMAVAQDQDHGDHDRDRERERMTRIEPGTQIVVRTNERIDADRSDDRIYRGIVDRVVLGENGRVAIPQGSPVELKVRVTPDNDLILDLEAISVNGERYGLRADADRIEAKHDDSVLGTILGTVAGIEVRGRAVRVPRDSQLTFRLERPLEVDRRDEHRDHDDKR